MVFSRFSLTKTVSRLHSTGNTIERKPSIHHSCHKVPHWLEHIKVTPGKMRKYAKMSQSSLMHRKQWIKPSGEQETPKLASRPEKTVGTLTRFLSRTRPQEFIDNVCFISELCDIFAHYLFPKEFILCVPSNGELCDTNAVYLLLGNVCAALIITEKLSL